MFAQQVLSRWWRSVGRPARAAFFGGLAMGLAAWLFRMTNVFFTTGDALNNVWFNGNMAWSGRWSSEWLSALSSQWEVPHITVLIVIAAIALLAVTVVQLLEVRSVLCALLMTGVLVTFPSVADTLGYLHNADAYLLAAFVSVLGFALMEKRRWGFVPGVLLMAVGVGTYQACASLVIALMFVRAVLLTAEGTQTVRALLQRAGKYVLAMACTLAVYYGMAQLVCLFYGFEIGSYQSLGDAASLGTLTSLPRNFIECYRDFLRAIRPFSDLEEYRVWWWQNVLLMPLTAGMALMVFACGGEEKRARFWVLLALGIMAPFFLCSIRIFNPDVVAPRMTYSASGLFLLAAALMDRLPQTAGKLPRRALKAGAALSWLAAGCIALSVCGWTVGANVSFYNGKMDYENMYARSAEYLAMAEKDSDYQRGMPVLVIGGASHTEARNRPDLYDTKAYYAFMKFCLNADMPFGVANEVRDRARAIGETEAFLAMPNYPADGCVDMIDGCIVVKLNDVVW